MGGKGRKRPTTLRGVEVVSILRKMGAKPGAQEGSHLGMTIQLESAPSGQPRVRTFTVPNVRKDLPPNTLSSILRSLGPKLREEFWDTYFGFKESSPRNAAPGQGVGKGD